MSYLSPGSIPFFLPTCKPIDKFVLMDHSFSIRELDEPKKKFKASSFCFALQKTPLTVDNIFDEKASGRA